MKNLTRFLAEAFFARELDEDYNLGLRYGTANNRCATLTQLQILHDQAAKRDQPGIAKAIKNLGGVVKVAAE
jgi:hypothetical protein